MEVTTPCWIHSICLQTARLPQSGTDGWKGDNITDRCNKKSTCAQKRMNKDSLIRWICCFFIASINDIIPWSSMYHSTRDQKNCLPPNNPNMIKTDYNSYKKPVNLICCIGMKRADEHFEGYVNKVLPFYTNPQTVHWCWVSPWSCHRLVWVSVLQHAEPSPYLTQPQLLPSTPEKHSKK